MSAVIPDDSAVIPAKAGIQFFKHIVGQERAVAELQAAAERPIHAYLFVGPAGAGKRVAANAFAAALLNDERALTGAHPDVHVIEREGASISVAQAREIARVASMSPLEGARKILILDDFHLVADAAPALLKTIEEASDSTVFVILAESVPKELLTVASRCVSIEFRSVAVSVIVEALVSSGISAEHAAAIAEVSFGDLDRARLLASDDTVIARHQLWVDVPTRLDGTGSAAAESAVAIAASIDAASEHLSQQQSQEMSSLKQEVERGAATQTALKTLETTHKRQLRRLRADELRAGFATISQELSRRLQIAPEGSLVKRVQACLQSLRWANESLEFNPNEMLLLQGLFVKLTEDLQS